MAVETTSRRVELKRCALKLAWIVGLAAFLAPGSAAQTTASFRPEVALTTAYYLQEGIKSIEQQFQVLGGKPEAAYLEAAVNGFQAACAELASYWKEKGVDLSLEPALLEVREAAFLEQARTHLESQQLAAAKQAVQSAYEAVLGVPYRALADEYTQVGEQGGTDWSFTGWLELAGVRLKQRDARSAEEALWKAYSSTTDLGADEKEPVRKAFEALADRIGRTLVSQGDYATAKIHFLNVAAAPELQKTEALHSALGFVCFELGDITCASEHLGKAHGFGSGRTMRDALSQAQYLLKQALELPASYAKATQFVEVWRTIVPGDDEILKAVATAQVGQAELQAWIQQTADCGIKARLVEVLQQGSPAEPFLDLAQAVLACDTQNASAARAVATANYRLAAQAWNALAQEQPKDLAAASSKIASVRALLSNAEGAERTPELRQKLDGYEAALQTNARNELERREHERKMQCQTLLERSRSAREQERVAISDLSDIVDGVKKTSASCTTYLDESKQKELGEGMLELSARLLKECDAEYYRLPDLPPDPSTLRQDQLDSLRYMFQSYATACQPLIATSSFRAEKIETVLNRIENVQGKP